MGAFRGRIRVAVPRMGIGETAATTLALVVHELATNSVKYGALSIESGTLDVSGSNDDEHVSLVWIERGGPSVSKPPGGEGYGSKLLLRSVTGYFGGTIDFDWAEGGLVVTLTLRSDRLSG